MVDQPCTPEEAVEVAPVAPIAQLPLEARPPSLTEEMAGRATGMERWISVAMGFGCCLLPQFSVALSRARRL